MRTTSIYPNRFFLGLIFAVLFLFAQALGFIHKLDHGLSLSQTELCAQCTYDASQQIDAVGTAITVWYMPLLIAFVLHLHKTQDRLSLYHLLSQSRAPPVTSQ